MSASPPNKGRFQFGLRELFAVITIIAIWVGWFAYSRDLWRATNRENAALTVAMARQQIESAFQVERENAARFAALPVGDSPEMVKVRHDNAIRLYRTQRSNVEVYKGSLGEEDLEQLRQLVDEIWQRDYDEPVPQYP